VGLAHRAQTLKMSLPEPWNGGFSDAAVCGVSRGADSRCASFDARIPGALTVSCQPALPYLLSPSSSSPSQISVGRASLEGRRFVLGPRPLSRVAEQTAKRNLMQDERTQAVVPPSLRAAEIVRLAHAATHLPDYSTSMR